MPAGLVASDVGEQPATKVMSIDVIKGKRDKNLQVML